MDSDFKKINLETGARKKPGFFGIVKPIFILASIIIVIAAIWSFFSSGSSAFKYVYSTVTQQNPLRSTDDRVNVLLLGNAGGKHDGPELTDSIIVASYDLKTNRATLISVPRDLWVADVSGKVNSVYEIGVERPEGGLKFAEDKIDDILGIPIHYAIRLDFDGFAKAIDLVEGIDVEVPKTFDDYNYPVTGKEDDLCGLIEKEVDLTEERLKEIDPDRKLNIKSGKQKLLVDDKDKIATEAADFACRFEHIHYTKGKTHMDGETALKFVRSRMGTNGEGSDFARSRRQQLVLQAFRDKALSLQTLINPQKITGLFSTFGSSVETDIEKERFLDFYGLVKKMAGTSSIVLGDLGGGKTVFNVGSPVKYGGYVLVSPDESNDQASSASQYKTVNDFVRQKLQEESTQSAVLEKNGK